jgi:hypothetical protein
LKKYISLFDEADCGEKYFSHYVPDQMKTFYAIRLDEE